MTTQMNTTGAEKQSLVYVWCPQYCFCGWEGGPVDLVICRTRATARAILAKHKKENTWSKPIPKSMYWGIVKRKVV